MGYVFKEPIYSILPRKSNTIYVDDYCYLYEGNKNRECGCIGLKNKNIFCSIFLDFIYAVSIKIFFF